jgi:hypothetical protein
MPQAATGPHASRKCAPGDLVSATPRRAMYRRDPPRTPGRPRLGDRAVQDHPVARGRRDDLYDVRPVVGVAVLARQAVFASPASPAAGVGPLFGGGPRRRRASPIAPGPVHSSRAAGWPAARPAGASPQGRASRGASACFDSYGCARLRYHLLRLPRSISCCSSSMASSSSAACSSSSRTSAAWRRISASAVAAYILARSILTRRSALSASTSPRSTASRRAQPVQYLPHLRVAGRGAGLRCRPLPGGGLARAVGPAEAIGGYDFG